MDRDERIARRIAEVAARNEALYERYYAEARARRLAAERPQRSHLTVVAQDIEEAAEGYRGVDFDDADVTEVG